MAHKKDLGLFKIRGLVIPAAWGEKGKVLAVAVSTFKEDEYLVARDEKGDQLLGLLREEVEVSGEVGIKDDVKTIKVKKYLLIKESEFIEGALEKQREGHAKRESVLKE